MTMINKTVGFWLKFLAKIIDVFIMSIIAVASSFLFLERRNGNLWFIYSWMFYIWGSIFILTILVLFIGIPILLKGKTIGMSILRIKIISKNDNLIMGIIKREVFFSFIWMLNIILVIVVINHTLINYYARTKQSNITYTMWEWLRISIVTSIGSITIIIQMIFSVSSIVRKDKTSLHDIYANTSVVYIKKFVKVKKNILENNKIKPVIVKNNPVKWEK